jgi:hypothetical protein
MYAIAEQQKAMPEIKYSALFAAGMPNSRATNNQNAAVRERAVLVRSIRLC